MSMFPSTIIRIRDLVTAPPAPVLHALVTCAAVVLLPCSATSQSYSMMEFFHKHAGLVQIKDQKTSVRVGSVNCSASKFVVGTILPYGEDWPHATQLKLEYEAEVTIDDRRDACADADEIPGVNIEFILTPTNVTDNELEFKGEKRPDCETCKPKRIRAISGKINKVSEDELHLLIEGDIVDSVPVKVRKLQAAQ